MEFLTIDDICRINRALIDWYDGLQFTPDNLTVGGRRSLEFVLGALTASVFGVELYPTLVSKAARLAWTIAKNHVFYDTNKRTAVIAATVFLQLNGATIDLEDDDVEKTMEAIARGDMEFEEAETWLAAHVQIPRSRSRTREK